MKKYRKDDRGFTLVELLIAMAIIAIVLTPLYSNFRQSTYLNGKAKKAMDATNMASDIMEGLSAYSPEEIAKSFTSVDEELYVNRASKPRDNYLSILPSYVQLSAYGEARPNSTTGGYDMLNNVMSYGATTGVFTDEIGSAIAGIPTIKYATPSDPNTNVVYVMPISKTNEIVDPFPKYLKIKESSDHKYYFYATDVVDTNNDGRTGLNTYKYDVIVELDANATSSGYEKMNSGFNEVYITNINPMFDASYVLQDKDVDEAVSALMLGLKTGSTVTAEDIRKNIYRDTVIQIERDVTANKDKVYITTVYTAPALAAKFKPTGGLYSTNTMEFNSIVSDVRDVYLYFTPNYYTTSKERFYVLNGDKRPVNIHLLHSKGADTDSSRENTYNNCEVYVAEGGWGAPTPIIDTSKNDVATKIYSNLRDDITLDMTVSANTINQRNRRNNPSIHKYYMCRYVAPPSTDDPNTIAQNVASYFAASVVVKDDTSFSNMDFSDFVVENGGLQFHHKDRLYSAKIYVYEAGSGTDRFTSDKLVTIYDGSSLE